MVSLLEPTITTIPISRHIGIVVIVGSNNARQYYWSVEYRMCYLIFIIHFMIEFDACSLLYYVDGYLGGKVSRLNNLRSMHF